MTTFRNLFLLGAAALSSSFAAGCTECSQADCSIGLDMAAHEGAAIVVTDGASAFSVSDAVAAHVCVGDECHDFTFMLGKGTLICDDDEAEGEGDGEGDFACDVGVDDVTFYFARALPDDTVTVAITVGTANTTLLDDTKEIDVSEAAPNGETCGPVCRIASATFQAPATSN